LNQLFVAAVPSMSIAFLIVFEMPIGIKNVMYKLPVWITSTVLNFFVFAMLGGWLIGPLGMFVGEFIMFPTLAWDKHRTVKKVRILKDAGMYPLGIGKNVNKLLREAKKAKKRKPNPIARLWHKVN